jgi:transcriptional regulator with XRE-family HTH domain
MATTTDCLDNKAIGQRLQLARDRYGISQSEAANFAGMTLKRWRELERGDSAATWYYPTLRSVIKFVRHLLPETPCN